MLICILTYRPEAAVYFTQALRDLGVEEVEVAATVATLVDLLVSHQVSGIALDVPAIVRASAQGKQLINDLSEDYPLVRLNWAPGKEITAMGNRFFDAQQTSILAFTQTCRLFSPRTMRRQERVAKVMNLYWEPVPGTMGERFRGFTLDVSAGGCFVCAFDPPPVGTVVRLEYHENENCSPALGQVTSTLIWGERSRPPGFGCKFIEKQSNDA